MSSPRPEATTALWWSLLAAVGTGVLGDVYLLWGRASASAFAAPALLVPALIAAALLAVCLAAAFTLWPSSRPAAAAGTGILLLAAALAVLNLVPPVARDELTHHLALPALYLRVQRIVEIPFAEQSYYPMLLEMAYTPLLLGLPDQLPKFLHLLYGLASAALLALYVRRQEGPGAAALAALLVLSTPVVFVLAASAYVDLGLLFYATGALVALLTWAEQPRPGWLITAGLLAGCAGATKYNGMLVIPLLAAGTVLLPQPAMSNRRQLAAAAIFIAAALVVPSPWLIKNWTETGNPIFPLFNTLLHGRPLPARASLDFLTQRRALYGESWLEIALLPVRIFITGREGDPARFDGVLSPLLLLGFAAVRRGASRREWLLAAYAAGFALSAFLLTALRVRYSIAIVAPLVLLTVQYWLHLHRAGGATAALAGLALGGALLFSAGHCGQLWLRLAPLSYLSGRLDRHAYIAQFIPEYPVLRVANSQLPASARIHLAFLGNRSYYCEREYVYDFGLSGGTLRRHIEAADSAAAIARSLRAEGISHLVTANALLDDYVQHNLAAAPGQRWAEFSRQYLLLLYSENGFGLYEIREP
ncbi:MAG: glycosyltransferase family 39 protein [Deltaproteobacteria bacterium]|nr:glycosyltransferase family 39 protein [Deltaproteobacteria bacterium]